MLPFAILMFLNIVVLTCWTAIAPLKWIRTDGTGIDSFNRVLESVGECTSDDDGPGSSPFVISLLIINISAVLGANYQAYKARNIQTDFSESKYIAITSKLMILATSCFLFVF
jgi:gamma-aminobutyric acid type B receptor